MAQDSGTIPFSPWVVRKRVTFGEPAILGPPIPGSVSHDNPDGLGVGPLRRPVELVKPTKPLPKLPRINREAPRPKRPTSLGKDAPGGASHHKLYGTTVDLGLPPERMRMTNDRLQLPIFTLPEKWRWRSPGAAAVPKAVPSVKSKTKPSPLSDESAYVSACEDQKRTAPDMPKQPINPTRRDRATQTDGTDSPTPSDGAQEDEPKLTPEPRAPDVKKPVDECGDQLLREASLQRGSEDVEGYAADSELSDYVPTTEDGSEDDLKANSEAEDEDEDEDEKKNVPLIGHKKTPKRVYVLPLKSVGQKPRRGKAAMLPPSQPRKVRGTKAAQATRAPRSKKMKASAAPAPRSTVATDDGQHEDQTDDQEIDRDPFVKGKPEPSRLTINLVDKKGQNRVYRYGHDVNWDDSKDIRKINHWQQQIFRRKIGVKRKAAHTYAKEENEWLVEYKEANTSQTWEEIALAFNDHFEGQRLASDPTVDRPARSKNSLYNQYRRLSGDAGRQNVQNKKRARPRDDELEDEPEDAPPARKARTQATTAQAQPAASKMPLQTGKKTRKAGEVAPQTSKKSRKKGEVAPAVESPQSQSSTSQYFHSVTPRKFEPQTVAQEENQTGPRRSSRLTKKTSKVAPSKSEPQIVAQAEKQTAPRKSSGPRKKMSKVAPRKVEPQIIAQAEEPTGLRKSSRIRKKTSK